MITSKSKWVITDEFLTKLKNSKIRIYGRIYVVSEETNFVIGDIVLDRGDGAHGIIDDIQGELCAVRDGCAIELGVPLNRLIKLKNEGILSKLQRTSLN